MYYQKYFRGRKNIFHTLTQCHDGHGLIANIFLTISGNMLHMVIHVQSLKNKNVLDELSTLI